jgi:hypothetical protein
MINWNKQYKMIRPEVEAETKSNKLKRFKQTSKT